MVPSFFSELDTQHVGTVDISTDSSVTLSKMLLVKNYLHAGKNRTYDIYDHCLRGSTMKEVVSAHVRDVCGWSAGV